MKKLRFKIIDVCYQDATFVSADDVDFFLEQDDWNDFSFHTTYHLHATANLTRKNNVYLGPIKILKLGQKEWENRVLANELKESHQGMVIESLPSNYYSISFSLELYRGLQHYLNDAERKLFVRVMRMIMGEDSPYYKTVKDEPAFQTSFLRFSNMDSDALKRGRMIMCKEGMPIKWEEQELSIKFTKADEPIQLDFSGIEGASDIDNVPSGVFAFIGHNGCGKSTSLYQIAKVLFANPSDRWQYKNILELSPVSIGVNKMLFFSYSAFDNFVLPGLTLSDYRLIINGLENNSGRFIFCGVRDVRKEMENFIKEYIANNTKSEDEPQERFTPIDIAYNDRQEEILLKPLKVLAEEFCIALQVVRQEGKMPLLLNIIEDSEILLYPLYTEINWLKDEKEDLAIQTSFLEKSTGIKFFLHSLIHLVAYLEDNSIILFDEPENHLHPPFLSFMMRSFRKIIHEMHSVMLVATHSPIVLQETFSKNVLILQRCGDKIAFKHPRIETYGESFGLINTEVFGLNTDITNYYDVIDALFVKWQCADLKSVSQVLNRFRLRMKVDELSSQMEAYIINKCYANHVGA